MRVVAGCAESTVPATDGTSMEPKNTDPAKALGPFVIIAFILQFGGRIDARQPQARNDK